MRNDWIVPLSPACGQLLGKASWSKLYLKIDTKKPMAARDLLPGGTCDSSFGLNSNVKH